MLNHVGFFIQLNMEIFRTDGGGHQKNPPRLIQVISLVMERIPNTSRLWANIISVEDNKGSLIIKLEKEFIDNLDETFIYYLFMKAWDKVGEDVDNVNIIYND